VNQFYVWIDFKPDGTFVSDGLLTWVGGDDYDWPKLPAKTSGTYEIRDWTIFFTLEDGRTWTSDFSTIRKDPKDLSGIMFRLKAFQKE